MDIFHTYNTRNHNRFLKYSLKWFNRSVQTQVWLGCCSRDVPTIALKALKYLIQTIDKGFFQFEIITNVSYVRFVWITIKWVYGHSKWFTRSVFSAGNDCQILTSKDDCRVEKVKLKLRKNMKINCGHFFNFDNNLELTERKCDEVLETVFSHRSGTSSGGKLTPALQRHAKSSSSNCLLFK